MGPGRLVLSRPNITSTGGLVRANTRGRTFCLEEVYMDSSLLMRACNPAPSSDQDIFACCHFSLEGPCTVPTRLSSHQAGRHALRSWHWIVKEGYNW